MRLSCRGVLLVLLLFLGVPIVAQAPGEVRGVNFSDRAGVFWNPTTGADHYNVYRGNISELASNPGRCHGFEVGGTSFSTPGDPPGDSLGYFFLITAETAAGEEGTPGTDSQGMPRPLLGSCRPVMRTHILNRLGYGWNEWTRDSIAALGPAAYIAEQLDPDTIDESTNLELQSELAKYDPPASIFELVARQNVQAVYARRQLEQQYTTFWTNHFNTDWSKVQNLFTQLYPPCGTAPQCDPTYPVVAQATASLKQLDEMEAFRDLGFNGNFREILEASALSPAMIIFLDNYVNFKNNPNENYARELLELYSMGVNGGYTQDDVEEMARVLTGWTFCRKELGTLKPTDPCIVNYWEPVPAGEWVAHFNENEHDCEAKVLFPDEPANRVDIPDTCGNLTLGVTDLGLALDGLVSHPATADFIVTKILQRFVTDTPDSAMISAIVAEWNDVTNPQGVGDLREVLRAALTLPEFLDPDGTGSKIKTPLEHFTSGLRAVRGTTDGLGPAFELLIYEFLSNHLPHFNPVPTGYDEVGSAWIDTNNTLQRQNFGLLMTAFADPAFGSDPITLLNDNGVSTAPGNADAIVDFFSDALFGGALTPEERQTAIDYLNTDDDELPSAYNDARIRETVGFMLGYPQFQEQ